MQIHEVVRRYTYMFVQTKVKPYSSKLLHTRVKPKGELTKNVCSGIHETLNRQGKHLTQARVRELSGKELDSRPRGRGFEPQRPFSVVSLSKNINPSFILVQPRKTRPFITEILLMGRKESNQTNNRQG